LRVLTKCENSFELAEKDMQIRGSGQFYGVRQSGLPDLAMDSLKDLNLVKTIRQEANDLLEKDLELKRLPLLSQKLLRFKQSIHLE
jgi:ATP-dependent DNA helicase RecG